MCYSLMMSGNHHVRPADKGSVADISLKCPRLRGAYDSLKIGRGHVKWLAGLDFRNLGWGTSLELFNHVQSIIDKFARSRILIFRKSLPALLDISPSDTIDAILNNWPEAIPQVHSHRREVLLCFAAHIVKHFETHVYQKIINGANNKELAKLGLTASLRKVAILTLDASIRVDNLFIRFLGLLNSSGRYPNCNRLAQLGASPSKIYLREDEGLHSLNDIFVRDSLYISRKFKEISELGDGWDELNGGRLYKKYLSALSLAFHERNIAKIDQRYKRVSNCFAELARSPFPILLVPPAYAEGGYEKPPYFDPEIRVGLSSPECTRLEQKITILQKEMASFLKSEGHRSLGLKLEKKKVRIINSIGDFGVNLKRKGYGQSGGQVIVAYLSEYLKSYKASLNEKGFYIEGLKESLRNDYSFCCNMFHELCHFHLEANDVSVARLGHKAAPIIQEIEAEQVYRWLIPTLIDSRKLEGSIKDWAAILLEVTLLEIMDKSKEADPEYFYSSAYVLNRALREGVIRYRAKDRVFWISNTVDFYRIQEEQANEVLALFRDKSMNSKLAWKWIQDNCEPNNLMSSFLGSLSKRKRHH